MSTHTRSAQEYRQDLLKYIEGMPGGEHILPHWEKGEPEAVGIELKCGSDRTYTDAVVTNAYPVSPGWYSQVSDGILQHGHATIVVPPLLARILEWNEEEYGPAYHMLGGHEDVQDVVGALKDYARIVGKVWGEDMEANDAESIVKAGCTIATTQAELESLLEVMCTLVDDGDAVTWEDALEAARVTLGMLKKS